MPCTTSQPSRAAASSASSAPSGAAPLNTDSRDERLYCSTIGCFAIASTIGGATKATDLMILGKLQELLEVESGHGDYLAALRQSIVHQDLHAVNMKKWRNDSIASPGQQRGPLSSEPDWQRSLMGQHHAFRESVVPDE